MIINTDDISTNAFKIVDQLAAIRSAAEILRDVQDLEAAERQRFAAIVLTGEARLEAMLSFAYRS